MKIYRVICEDLSGLGGPMGTETVRILWSKPHKIINSAYVTAWTWWKDYCLKHNRTDTILMWNKDHNGNYHTQDLGSHMFKIIVENVE